jgi:hypothetical protein
MLPCLVSLWKRPGRARLVRACAYAALCGFMFGFHVHEKASLTFVLLMGLEVFKSVHSSRFAAAFTFTIISYPADHGCIFAPAFLLSCFPPHSSYVRCYVVLSLTPLSCFHGTGASMSSLEHDEGLVHVQGVPSRVHSSDLLPAAFAISERRVCD